MEAAFAGGFPFEMFHAVGDVGFGASDAGFFECFVEHAAGGADEWFAFEIFFVAGLFADENDAGMFGAFAEDGLGAGFPEGTGSALFGGGTQGFEVARGGRFSDVNFDSNFTHPAR